MSDALTIALARSLDEALCATAHRLAAIVVEADGDVMPDRYLIAVRLTNGVVHTAEGEYLGEVSG